MSRPFLAEDDQALAELLMGGGAGLSVLRSMSYEHSR
jgi:hypothetical protein